MRSSDIFFTSLLHKRSIADGANVLISRNYQRPCFKTQVEVKTKREGAANSVAGSTQHYGGSLLVLINVAWSLNE